MASAGAKKGCDTALRHNKRGILQVGTGTLEKKMPDIYFILKEKEAWITLNK